MNDICINYVLIKHMGEKIIMTKRIGINCLISELLFCVRLLQLIAYAAAFRYRICNFNRYLFGFTPILW